MDLSTFLSQVYFGNTVQAYAIALGIVLSSVLIAKIAKFILENKLVKWAEKTKHKIGKLVVDILLRPLVFLITIIGVYIAVDYLFLPASIEKWIKAFFQILIALKLTSSVSYLIGLLIDYYFDQHKHLHNNTNLRAISKVTVRVLLWVSIFIVVVTNLGYNLNSLLAGLGIGGVAIAFAVQGILQDLFSSVSIYIDRPFQIGDYIVVGEKKGTVQSIGMKTTRIKTLQGEELVIPNAMLTGKEIENFRKMQERRIVFLFGIVYETPLAKLKKIPKMIEEIVVKHENARFDRAHFTTFGDFSLNFEVVYFINSAEYNDYMDLQQAINFELMEQFEKEKIEFAYPTQKVLVAR